MNAPGPFEATPKEGGTPPATLVVVTRDRAALLERYLLASLHRVAEAGADVLVVDQSRDGRTKSLLDGVHGLRYVRSGPGLSRGRNAALLAGTGPIVAFTDDDVTLTPGWIDTIAAAFSDAPEAGAVCGRAVTEAGTLLPGSAAGLYRFPSNPFGLGSGFNIAFRRSALDAVGSFDEDLGAGSRFGAGEDTDMLYRLMRAGWAVVCRDDITVVHHSWRSFGSFVETQFRYGVGAGAQTAKHREAGDRFAMRIALKEGIRHVGWLIRSLATLRFEAALVQPVFVAGLILGFIRRRRAGSRR